MAQTSDHVISSFSFGGMSTQKRLKEVKEEGRYTIYILSEARHKQILLFPQMGDGIIKVYFRVT